MREHEPQARTRPLSAGDASKLRQAHALARARLLAEQSPQGCWPGRLSSSALSTATAVSALSLVSLDRFGSLIASGLRWLESDQHPDGGWGDTPDSPSNISTTLLADAAFQLARRTDQASPECVARGRRYIAQHAGESLSDVAAALRTVYGADRTFVVPILVNCALAAEATPGSAGPSASARSIWRHVPSLPFELAACPTRWLRWLRLHVVSYARPALIAMGQLIHARRPSLNPVLRLLRAAAARPTLRRLGQIQPESGGFIEAVPLTSFVTMSLVAAGQSDHAVVSRAVAFLGASARPDGSWPIDSDLSTWLTTLSVVALTVGSQSAVPNADATRRWLLACQHKSVHAYTNSPPGGWAWTDLSGGVPDADDTSGALLALARLAGPGVDDAARAGCQWLLGLQNGDGGWPTFCRGWGKLPFDRSSPDLTAHALRALAAWSPAALGWEELQAAQPSAAVLQGMTRGWEYLRRAQRPDGSWVPLWFGNQYAAQQHNPVYGTSRVLAAYRDLDRADAPDARRAVAYLVQAQGRDGMWGGDRGVQGTIEETALAVDALTRWANDPATASACLHGAKSLADAVLAGGLERASPIGLYFAKLWYSEQLYPIIYAVAALARAVLRFGAGLRGRGAHETPQTLGER